MILVMFRLKTYNLLNMKLLWVQTIFYSGCPYENAEYASANSLMAHFTSGVNSWQSCGALCHAWNKPGKCEIWSFMPKKGICKLFAEFDGKFSHLNYWMTGQVHCFSSSEEK